MHLWWYRDGCARKRRPADPPNIAERALHAARHLEGPLVEAKVWKVALWSRSRPDSRAQTHWPSWMKEATPSRTGQVIRLEVKFCAENKVAI